MQFIHKLTGTVMWVADDRNDEYIKAGHKPALNVTEEAKKPTRKRRTTTKTKK